MGGLSIQDRFGPAFTDVRNRKGRCARVLSKDTGPYYKLAINRAKIGSLDLIFLLGLILYRTHSASLASLSESSS